MIAKEVVFTLVCLFVGWFVYLFVFKQDYTKITGWIIMKYECGKKALNSNADPDQFVFFTSTLQGVFQHFPHFPRVY